MQHCFFFIMYPIPNVQKIQYKCIKEQSIVQLSLFLLHFCLFPSSVSPILSSFSFKAQKPEVSGGSSKPHIMGRSYIQDIWSKQS